MNAPLLQHGDSARSVLRLGMVLLLMAACAGVWEVLASQVPGSLLSIRMLPAPIERLRVDALTFGVLAWLAGLGALAAQREVSRRARVLLALGALVLLVSDVYAALNGMPGVQAQDLRLDATWVFTGKLAGRALFVAGLVDCARWVLGVRRPRIVSPK